MVDGAVVNAPTRSTSQGSYKADLKNRGSVSHNIAQGHGLAAVLRGSCGLIKRSIRHAIGTHTYDDASYWFQKPVAPRGNPFSNNFMKRLEKNSGAKGRNVHLPVLNNAECLYVSQR